MKVEYVPVQTDEFDTEISYQTDDGKIFRTEAMAQAHEDMLIVGKVPQLAHDIQAYSYWYKPTTEKELQAVIRYLHRLGQRVHGESELKVGEWFSCHIDYNPEGPDVVYCIRAEEFLKSLEQLKERLK